MAELGPQHCLDWALRTICRVSRWVGSSSKSGVTDISNGTPRLCSTLFTPTSLPAAKRKVDGFGEGKDATRKRTCPRTYNDRFETFDRFRNYAMKGICPKRSCMRDPPPSPLAQFPRQADSPASPALMSPPSSMHSSSSTRVLPTLPSLDLASCPDVLPNPSPSADLSHSAQTAHLQDLQHQISTRTLALQTLQCEHDHLLSAFSRSQIRCATLEKKFQVSDTEINTLTEERLKLLSQIEAYETRVEELMGSREEARKQSVANGGQYMKIMAMASRLEAQGAADKKEWTSEREAWDREREEFGREIRRLQKETEKVACAEQASVTDRVPTAGSSTAPLQLRSLGRCFSVHTHSSILDGAPSMEGDDILTSTSLVTLRDEIVRLRGNCSGMKIALQDVRTEGERMEQAMHMMASIKQQIATKVGACIRNCKYPNGSCSQRGREKSAGDGGRQAQRSRSPC